VKGKGKLPSVDPPQPPAPHPSSSSSSSWAEAAPGRFSLRRGEVDLGGSLGGGGLLRSDPRAAMVTRLRADAMQYEYEDEYDDSYDDLSSSAGGLDALCEPEDSHQGVRGGAGAVPASEGPPSLPKQAPLKVFHVGKDGRIYNYKKKDSEVINARSQEEVSAILRERKNVIHGLGAGGNVPSSVSQRKTQEAPQSSDVDSNLVRGESGRGIRGEVGPKHDGKGRDEPAGQAKSGNGCGGRVEGDGVGNGQEGAEGGRGGGEDRGREGGGQGGRGGFASKEKHKAGVSNHHRKDRATAKMNAANRGF